LADAAVAGSPVEQVPGLTSKWARRSPLMRRSLELIALALAGRAGARLAMLMGLAASRSSMLRLIRALPDPAADEVTVLGVDRLAGTSHPAALPAGPRTARAGCHDPGDRRQLGLARGTVRRFARASNVDEILAKPHPKRPRILDDHADYLRERLAAGVTNAVTLFAELRERGYRGSTTTLRTYLRPLRAAAGRPPAPRRPPKTRQLTSWILTHPDRLDDNDREHAQARAACPHLDALATHVSAFAEIMTARQGQQLNDWITAVEADDQPDLRSFTAGLRRDHDAVVNGLTMTHSSGVVEGHVNRIILWNP
jgi:hypothetical protein